MRLKTLTILSLSAMFLAGPALAQMTQQNRPNQGHDANPPKSSSGTAGAQEGSGSGQSGANQGTGR